MFRISIIACFILLSNIVLAQGGGTGSDLDLSPISSYLNTPVTDQLTMDMIKRISPFWFGFAIILFGVKVAYSTGSAVLEASVSETPKIPVNYMELLRGMVFVLLIGVFPQFFMGIQSFVRGTNDFSDTSTEAYANMEKVSNEFFYESQVAPYRENIKSAKAGYKAALESGDPSQIAAQKIVVQEAMKDGLKAKALAEQQMDGSVDGQDIQPNDFTPETLDKATSGGYNFFMNPVKMVGLFLSGIFTLIALGIKVIIMMWAKFAFGIIGCLGMIALTFGIWNPNIPSVWFAKLLNIGLSFTVINILDQYMTHFWSYVWNSGLLVEGVEIGNLMTISIVIIASYASVFTLTSYVVGGTGAGRIVSKSIGIMSLFIAGAASGVAAAIGGGAGASSSAGSSGGSSINNAAKGFVTTSKTLKDE